MGDPDLNSGEQVLLRTPGILVKSIPFEGILTDRRIILVDRAKNIIPTRDVPFSTIQYVESGENAIRDPVLTIAVTGSSGESRQMVLTFSREIGGSRARVRDEWVRILLDILASLRTQATAPRRVPVKRVVETGPSARSPVSPAPVPPPVARQPEVPPAGDSVFCSRCGNRVAAGSVFCNRCGTPIVAPPGAQQSQPAPGPQYSPPPAAEPAYEAPPSVRIPPVSPRAPPVQAAPEPAPARYDEGEAGRIPVSRPAAAAQPVQKPVKKGFFSRIFSSGGKKPAAAKPPAPPAPERKPRRSLMPGKKAIMAVVAVIVVIAVIAVGAVVVYPMLSSSGGSILGGGSGTTATLSNTGVASITVKETTPPAVPVSGVWVVTDYVGSYGGSYGMASDPQEITDSGSRLYEVVNATGKITAELAKQDSSTKHALTVSIYKDGALLESDSTSASYGKVSISADVGGTTEPESSSTGSGATGNVTSQTTESSAVNASVTTVKAAANATAVTTKAATATKTTVKTTATTKTT
ncbi:MAG: zinc-ribbon domain-containing protein [Methanoregula sp.]